MYRPSRFHNRNSFMLLLMSVDARTKRVSQQLRAIHRLASGHLMHEMGKEMQELDLSFSQVGALVHLRHHGHLSVSRLASLLRLSLPATSHVVERTLQRGLLRREEDPEDRRSKRLALTPQGEALLERIEHASHQAYAALMQGMTEADLEALEAALSRLIPQGRPCPFEENV